MKLTAVKVEKHDMKLKAPWAIAGHVHESIENIFIEITDENGMTGIGSCAPADDSPENLNHYFKTLNNKSAKDLLDETDCIIEIRPKKYSVWKY